MPLENRNAVRCFVSASLLLAGCAMVARGQPVDRETAQATEVVVIGGDHYGIYYNPNYSPAHLRALLNKIAPAAVGVENLAHWQKAGVLLHPFAAELGVTLSWAKTAGVPAHGVRGHSDLAGWDENATTLRAYRDSTSVGERLARARNGVRRQVGTQARVSHGDGQSITYRHSRGAIDSLQASRAQQFTAAQNATMDGYDDSITVNILRLARTLPGQRIAVVFGWFHLGPLMERLERQPGIRVIPAERFLPLTKRELDAAWHRDDAIMMLGSDLDSWMARHAPVSRDQGRAKRRVEELTRAEAESPTTLYYRARWHMSLGEWERAAPLLLKVRQAAPGHDASFPPTPPWRRLARRPT